MTDYTALNVDLSLVGPELTLLIASFVILSFIALKRMNDWAPSIGIVALLVALYLAGKQWFLDPTSGFADE